MSSALVTTESLRALDRLRLRANLTDFEVANRRTTILQLIAPLELVEIDAVVLERAAQPLPTEIGTLDAIHLATALLWRDMTREARDGDPRWRAGARCEGSGSANRRCGRVRFVA